MKKPRHFRLFIYRKVDDYWYWRLVASNGYTVAQCILGFTRSCNALKAAERLFACPCPEPQFEEPPEHRALGSWVTRGRIAAGLRKE